MPAKNKNAVIEFPSWISHPTAVLGAKDNFYNLIRADTSVKMKYNNNSISLFGQPKEIERIQRIFDKIFEVLAQGQVLDKEDIYLYLSQSKNGTLYFPTSVGDDILLKIGKKIVRAKSIRQIEYIDCIMQNTITFGMGPAGSGKSYLTTITALRMLQEKMISKVVITRPNVGLANLSIGYLPGSANDKLAGFVNPILSIFREYLGDDRTDEYIEKGVLEILPLEYIRGYSFSGDAGKGTFIICDESQNLRVSSFLSILTRVGKNSKLVILGDKSQNDIGKDSGLEFTANLLEDVNGLGVFRFTNDDIIRSQIVKDILEKFEQAGLV